MNVPPHTPCENVASEALLQLQTSSVKPSRKVTFDASSSQIKMKGVTPSEHIASDALLQLQTSSVKKEVAHSHSPQQVTFHNLVPIFKKPGLFFAQMENGDMRTIFVIVEKQPGSGSDSFSLRVVRNITSENLHHSQIPSKEGTRFECIMDHGSFTAAYPSV